MDGNLTILTLCINMLAGVGAFTIGLIIAWSQGLIMIG